MRETTFSRIVDLGKNRIKFEVYVPHSYEAGVQVTRWSERNKAWITSSPFSYWWSPDDLVKLSKALVELTEEWLAYKAIHGALETMMADFEPIPTLDEIEESLRQQVADGYLEVRIDPDGSESYRVTEKGFEEAANIVRRINEENNAD